MSLECPEGGDPDGPGVQRLHTVGILITALVSSLGNGPDTLGDGFPLMATSPVMQTFLKGLRGGTIQWHAQLRAVSWVSPLDGKGTVQRLSPM